MSRFPRYILFYISENRFPWGQCMSLSFPHPRGQLFLWPIPPRNATLLLPLPPGGGGGGKFFLGGRPLSRPTSQPSNNQLLLPSTIQDTAKYSTNIFSRYTLTYSTCAVGWSDFWEEKNGHPASCDKLLTFKCVFFITWHRTPENFGCYPNFLRNGFGAKNEEKLKTHFFP